MSQDILSSASKVVELFKHELDTSSRNCLSINDYERLAELIAAALSAERNASAELMERIANKIKSGVGRFDLDL